MRERLANKKVILFKLNKEDKLCMFRGELDVLYSNKSTTIFRSKEMSNSILVCIYEGIMHGGAIWYEIPSDLKEEDREAFEKKCEIMAAKELIKIYKKKIKLMAIAENNYKHKIGNLSHIIHKENMDDKS